MYFLSSNGREMENDVPNSFAQNFDWVITPNNIYKNKDIPNTIYIKTDFLPLLVNKVLPQIRNNFILISSCSDYSPSVNFSREYNIIINNPYLIKWYASNKVHEHEKVKALPGGLCSYPNEIHEQLLKLNKETMNMNKKNKILCCWRDRDFNVCGNEFITRSKVKEFVLKYPEFFDWVEANINTTEIYNLLASYKYILCPVGNGVDPCPKSHEAIILNTIPIIIRTNNTIGVYDELPCIMVNDFKEIIESNFLEQKYEELKHLLYSDETLKRLSAEWWVNKIKSE